MAQVDNDFTTQEWWLLCDVLTFVMRYCGSAWAAESLFLDFAECGHFDKRFRFHHPGDERPIKILPRRWGKLNSQFGTEITIEWPDSCVVVRHTTGNSSGLAPAFQNLLSGYGFAPDGYRMYLVRLHRDDVLSMLQLAGLSEAPVDTEKSRRRRPRRRPQFELTCEALRAEFPPKGQTPRSMLLKTIGGRIANYVKAKNQAESLSLEIPNDDIIAEAIEHLGQS